MTTTTTDPEYGLFLELDGDVYVIDRSKGKKATREKLDGTVVLEALSRFISSAIEAAVDRYEFETEEAPKSLSKPKPKKSKKPNKPKKVKR